MYHNGKEVKEEFKALYDYLDYLEIMYINARKTYVKQEYMDMLDYVYKYLDYLAYHNKLYKD